jgi:NAD(P)-dependent dehydrogenase (short-subunit alcohol dehydrogenase family)
MDLSGKVALVTGAGSGIGRATAIKLAEEGAEIAILYAFDEEDAVQTGKMVQDYGRDSLVVYADIRKKTLVELAMDDIIRKFGRLDILVNSAGAYHFAPFLEIAEADLDAVIDTNLKGTFFCSQAAARAMVACGAHGKILLISSTQGIRPVLGTPHYAASKSGMFAMAKSMALDLARYHINVNVVCPGVIESAGNLPKLRDPQVRIDVENQIPWQRVGQPGDVANLCAFLASDAADYLTGSVIAIDGGLLAAGPQI